MCWLTDGVTRIPPESAIVYVTSLKNIMPSLTHVILAKWASFKLGLS